MSGRDRRKCIRRRNRRGRDKGYSGMDKSREGGIGWGAKQEGQKGAGGTGVGAGWTGVVV